MRRLKKIENLKSLADRELMELIFSNQINILRQMEFMQHSIDQVLYGKKDAGDMTKHPESVDNSLHKCESMHKKINKNLKGYYDKLDEEEKKPIN